ncbi:dihydrofolate reductase [Polymorphobacter sp.]|uniref:dihydrofolate reductase n=1 Tax=Polymorphobacter sp. TaxID=1909290 RepID=UPI003F70A7B4
MTGGLEVVLVVARADNGVIGRDGTLPWRLSADLKRFKALTVGKPVLMGRKTFESIGRPLPGRHNIVLTRQPGWQADGVSVAPNLAEAIAAAGMDPRARAAALMVIGGADIYAQALPLADRVELTEVHVDADGDTVLPAFNAAVWREVARERHEADGTAPAHSYVTLVRRE